MHEINLPGNTNKHRVSNTFRCFGIFKNFSDFHLVIYFFEFFLRTFTIDKTIFDLVYNFPAAHYVLVSENLARKLFNSRLNSYIKLFAKRKISIGIYDTHIISSTSAKFLLELLNTTIIVYRWCQRSTRGEPRAQNLSCRHYFQPVDCREHRIGCSALVCWLPRGVIGFFSMLPSFFFFFVRKLISIRYFLSFSLKLVVESNYRYKVSTDIDAHGLMCLIF